LDEEKPKYAGLAQENSFGTAKFAMAQLVKCTATTNTTTGKECNKYDLTAKQCSWLAYNNNDWSRWFAIVVVNSYYN